MVEELVFSEDELLWSGRCTYVFGDDLLPGEEGVLSVFPEGLELTTENSRSYLSFQLPDNNPSEESSRTRIGFKGLLVAKPRTADMVTVRSQSRGALSIFNVENPRLLTKLISFLVARQAGVAPEAHNDMWRRRKEVDLLSSLENEELFKDFKKTFAFSSTDDPGELIACFQRALVEEGARQQVCQIFLTTRYLCVQGQATDRATRRKDCVLDLLCIRTIDVRKTVITVQKAKTPVTPDGDEGDDVKAKVITLRFPGKSPDDVRGIFDKIRDAWLFACYGKASKQKPSALSRAELLSILRRLHLHFDSLDTRRDGFVRNKDFQQAMRPLLQSSDFSNYLFRALANEKHEKMSFITFLKGMTATVLGGVTDRLNFSFKLFDVNQDGCIDEKEFTEALRLFHSLNRFHLQDESLEHFARKLFNQELSPRDERPGTTRYMTFREYQTCLLHNTQLHKASDSLANFAISHLNTDSATSGKGAADRFILFGNKDWELASRILHGITKATEAAYAVNTDSIEELVADPGRKQDVGQLVKWLQGERYRVERYILESPNEPIEPAGERRSPLNCCGPRGAAFTDYAPQIFKLLRQRYGIDKTRYLRSLGIDIMVFNLVFGSLFTLKQMSSSGQSGSIFFVSHDERFIVKSLPRNEAETLRRILPDYFTHMMSNPDSLITRFCGLYAVQLHGKTITLVVMTHAFTPTPGKKIRQTYDLKGSTVNRLVSESDGKAASVALKEMNLNRKFDLRWDWRQRLLMQVHIDASFLESIGLIDYSFLLGIDSYRQRTEVPFKGTIANKSLKALKTHEKMVNRGTGCCGNPAAMEPLTDFVTTAFPVNIADSSDISGRSVFKVHEGGVPTADGTEVVYFGIIDVLTTYNLQKWSEHRLKRCFHGRMRMSCVPPKQYRARFVTFLEEVFTKSTDSPPLLKLPATVHPGGRYRAVSDAGLIVEIVVSAHPTPTFWVITRPSALAAEGQEVVVVRCKCALSEVIFSKPILYFPVALSKPEKQRPGLSELVVTVRAQRLYPQVQNFKMDLHTRFRLLACAYQAQHLTTSHLSNFTRDVVPIAVAHVMSDHRPGTVYHGVKDQAITSLLTYVNENPASCRILFVVIGPSKSDTVPTTPLAHYNVSTFSMASTTAPSLATVSESHPSVHFLALGLSSSHFLESFVESKDVTIAFFLAYSEKGLFNEVRTGAASPGHSVCAMLAQCGETPFAIVAMPTEPEPREYQSAMRFASRALRTQGSLLANVPAVFWTTFDASPEDDDPSSSQSTIAGDMAPANPGGVLHNFAPVRGLQGQLAYTNRDAPAVAEYQAHVPLLGDRSWVAGFVLHLRDDVFAPLAKYSPENGVTLCLSEFRLASDDPADRWPDAAVCLNVSSDVIPGPVLLGAGAVGADHAWAFPSGELLPLGETGHRLLTMGLMAEFLARRTLVFTLCLPSDLKRPNQHWLYQGCLQGTLQLSNLPKDVTVELSDFGLPSKWKLTGRVSLR